MDIVGSTVASLCEAYDTCISSEDGIHRVNLLFDRENDAIKVSSPYPNGTMTITVKQPGKVLVRIPSWADRSRLSVEGVKWYIDGDMVTFRKLRWVKRYRLHFL